MTVADAILALAELRGDLDGKAEREAKQDRYASASEFQTLARGVGMAMEKLEEIKREEK